MTWNEDFFLMARIMLQMQEGHHFKNSVLGYQFSIF